MVLSGDNVNHQRSPGPGFRYPQIVQQLAVHGELFTILNFICRTLVADIDAMM